jgi:hypothetical protein
MFHKFIAFQSVYRCAAYIKTYLSTVGRLTRRYTTHFFENFENTNKTKNTKQTNVDF